MKKRKVQQVLWEADGFAVGATGLRVTGERPTSEQWAALGLKLARLRGGSSWAIGDWLLLGDALEVEEGRYEAAAEQTGLKRGTLMNLKSVAKAFPPSQRRASLSWSHYALVAGFDEETRHGLLLRAAREKLSWDELRALAREERHRQRTVMQAWPEGTYGVVYVDCPWHYEDGTTDPTRRVDNQYPVMTTDQLCALAPNVQRVMAPDCVMYFWATNPMLEEALQVLKAWGLHYKTNHVWVKDRMGMGYWNRGRHELLLIATRGNPVTPAEDLRPDSVIVADRREHSRKPDDVYEMLERCYASAPKLELFARTPREGWTAWGNEIAAETAPAPGRGIRLGDVAQATA
jgi:N6-adenosine-specific RNA methylase IME4